jgi:catechol 2,3-dioxygenase-like lactoylglutathione lyase family enzyme
VPIAAVGPTFTPLSLEAVMLDHVSLGTHDLDRATDFYSRLLACLDWSVQRRSADEVAFGTTTDWTFFLYPADPESTPVGARMHVAFRAPDRRTALAFERTALALGATSVRDVAERPQFGADYFGGVLRDPDGHAIEVLTRGA